MALLTFLFVAFYGYALYKLRNNTKWRLQPKPSRIIKLAHYSGLVICIALIWIKVNYELSLRGFWISRTIFLFVLLTGLFFILVADRSIMHKAERWYFKLFSWFPVFTAAFLFVPFIGIVIVASLLGQLLDPVHKIHFEDDKIRVQSGFRGVLAAPAIDVYQKGPVFEKLIRHTNIDDTGEMTARVLYDNDSTRVLLDNESYHDPAKIETDTIALPKVR